MDDGVVEPGLPRAPGIYALLLAVEGVVHKVIGGLGAHLLGPGLYAYVGSARGPGGLGARVRRHLHKTKGRLWWHIDYLTSDSLVRAVAVVYVVGVDAEEEVAKALLRGACWDGAVPGFGASDSSSPTHLLRCKCDRVSCLSELVEALRRATGGAEPRLLELGDRGARDS